MRLFLYPTIIIVGIATACNSPMQSTTHHNYLIKGQLWKEPDVDCMPPKICNATLYLPRDTAVIHLYEGDNFDSSSTYSIHRTDSSGQFRIETSSNRNWIIIVGLCRNFVVHDRGRGIDYCAAYSIAFNSLLTDVLIAGSAVQSVFASPVDGTLENLLQAGQAIAVAQSDKNALTLDAMEEAAKQAGGAVVRAAGVDFSIAEKMRVWAGR